MDISSLGWPWKTFIRSGHRTDRFDARKNENYLEWRDNGHLQARGHVTAAKLIGSNRTLSDSDLLQVEDQQCGTTSIGRHLPDSRPLPHPFDRAILHSGHYHIPPGSPSDPSRPLSCSPIAEKSLDQWLRAPAATDTELKCGMVQVQTTLVAGPEFEPTSAPARSMILVVCVPSQSPTYPVRPENSSSALM